MSVWWGLAAGLGEGLALRSTHSWIWRDLLWSAVIVEPLLFLLPAIVVFAVRRGRPLDSGTLLRLTFGYCWLALFDWERVGYAALDVRFAVLGTVAAASLVAFGFFLYSRQALRFQRRSVALLAGAAVLALILVPVKTHRHEQRDVARLPAAPGRAQNVLLVVLDTVRADHLSTYGYSRPTSPYLTELASEGVLFEQAIAPSSWTLPTHASILTGRYPHEHLADRDSSMFGYDNRTIGDAFQANGYRTAVFSANTLLFGRRRGFGRGFIHFEDDFQTWGSRFAMTFYGEKVYELLYRWGIRRDVMGRLHADDVNRHALRWIDSDRRPFLVILNYFDVHDPYLPPEPYRHFYTKAKNPGWYSSRSWVADLTPAECQDAMDAYDGAINYVDGQIKNLVAALKERGLDRDTLLIVTSDHGEAFNEHGFMDHGNALYQELIRVPLIMWEPGKVPAGVRVADPVSLTALPSTMLDEVGLNSPVPFPMQSLAELWRDPAHHVSPAPPISELAQLEWSPRFPNYYGPMVSITTPQWHYIFGGRYGEQLFAHADRAEKTDLAATNRGRTIVPVLREEMEAATRRAQSDRASRSEP